MVVGSCFVFNTDIIKEIGYLPEAYFMYYEETEWCYRAKKKGYYCVSIPTKWVYHKDKATVKNKGGFYEYMMERNRVVFVKRNATAGEFIRFLIYLPVRTVYYAKKNKKPYFKLLRTQIDGIFNRTSKEYPFIYIPEKRKRKKVWRENI